MVTTSTILNKDVQKALVQNQIIFWIVMVCLDSVTAVFSLILLEYFIFAMALVLDFISILLLVSLTKLVKNCKGDITNNYVFNEGYFTVESVKNDEKIGESKVYYKDVKKTKLINDYLFIYLSNISAFPIQMSKLKGYEIKILKSWLSIK